MTITPDMLVADVLAQHNELIPVLNRFGIRLGVGDFSFERMCESKNLNLDFILTVLNVYLNDSFVPTSLLELFEADLIADYFKNTLDNYTQDLIPNIEKHLNAFIAISGVQPDELKVLQDIVAELKHELSLHLQHAMQSNRYFPNELLHDLKTILIKHVSGNYNQNLCHAVIFSIHSFEQDVIAHNRLRKRILLPKINELESEDITEYEQLIAEDFILENMLAEDKKLTKREVDVLKLIVQGKTNRLIAEKLNISLNTVLTHRKNIISKTGVKTVSGLTFYAISNDYITPAELKIH